MTTAPTPVISESTQRILDRIAKCDRLKEVDAYFSELAAPCMSQWGTPDEEVDIVCVAYADKRIELGGR